MERKHENKGKETKVTALLLSGGRGSRMGSEIPKQYIEVGGKPVIAYCLETLAAHKRIDHIHIVADAAWHDEINRWIDNCSASPAAGISIDKKFSGFSEPGETRQLSIWNGLRDIGDFAADNDLVLIHDAARPVLSEKQIGDCIAAAQGHDGVMPVLPMKDTVYSGDGKQITGLLDRETVFAGQAPELFRFEPYYHANKQLMPDRIFAIKGSTQPAIMAGMDIVMIPGDERNFKITTKEDLERFESICTTWDR